MVSLPEGGRAFYDVCQPTALTLLLWIVSAVSCFFLLRRT
jgi:hypothetical protein